MIKIIKILNFFYIFVPTDEIIKQIEYYVYHICIRYQENIFVSPRNLFREKWYISNKDYLFSMKIYSMKQLLQYYK